MTLTLLKSKNNTRFWKNFFLDIKNSKKILVFVSVMQLLGFPLLAVCGLLEASDIDANSEMSIIAFSAISMFCLAAATLCGVFIAMSNFSYLHKKAQVDMIYSLPIKRTTKFLSDFSAGLAMYAVPYITACIIADIILMMGNALIPDFQKYEIIFGVNSIMPLVFQGEFAGLLAMIMLYALTVLVISCCGSLFECILNIFMINGLIPGAIGVIAAMFFGDLYGVPIFDTVAPMLGYTSPLGAIIYTFFTLENLDSGLYSQHCIPARIYGKWVMFFLMFTAAYFLLAMFLYKKRKAEDVSKPYVYKLLYYILVTVITMAISLIAKFAPETIFPIIIFSLIVYMIFEVITNRGFKKIHWSLIRYTATMIGILILCTLASATHGFGVEGKVYSPSMVKKVSVDYSGIDNIMAYTNDEEYEYYTNTSEYGALIEYSDKAIIERVLDVQKQAISTYRSGNYNAETYEPYYYYDPSEISDDELYDLPTYPVTLTFQLKTGGTTTRNYVLSFEQLKQLFILDTTEQMAIYKSERLMNYLENGSETVNGKRNVTYAIIYSRLKNVYDASEQVSITEAEAKELADLYKQDYMETTQEEFFTSRPLCYIHSSLPIRECYERTVGFMRKHGCLEESSKPNYLKNAEGMLYPPESYRSWGRNDITASFGKIGVRGRKHTLTSEQTNELLNYASADYYEEADCYVMNVRDTYYVIPSKYSDTAEKIYNESGNYQNKYTFDEMMFDMETCGSPQEYINRHTNNTVDFGARFYDDITAIYTMRFAYTPAPDPDLDYETVDTDMQYELYLLKRFFGYSSLDDVIDNMNSDSDLSENESAQLRTQWAEFCRTFPQITDDPETFYNNLS